MGERHTNTEWKRRRVTSTPSLLLDAVNRKRRIRMDIPLLVPPVWVGEDRTITAFGGRLVPRFAGIWYDLGPNQVLYGVTIGIFESVIHIQIEDRVDEGRFTDDGSGTAGTLPGGGGAEKDPAPTERPGTERSARGS